MRISKYMNSILGIFADNPAWFINDMLVVILFIASVFFIIKNEKNPTVILLEGVAFVFLYALVFDNIRSTTCATMRIVVPF